MSSAPRHPTSGGGRPIFANPGRFTCPSPPAFHGTRFLEQWFYELSNGPDRWLDGSDEDSYREVSVELWDLLEELRPSLWRESETYPHNIAHLDRLFANGEVDLTFRKLPAGVSPPSICALRKDARGLARTRYLRLERPEHLTARQAQDLAWLTRPSSQLATARASRWRIDFDGSDDQPAELAEAYLTRWRYRAMRSRLGPIEAFVRMVHGHRDGIVRWHETRTSNGILEGTNPLVQAAERKARGCRSKAKMITITYLIAGRLPLPSTHTI